MRFQTAVFHGLSVMVLAFLCSCVTPAVKPGSAVSLHSPTLAQKWKEEVDVDGVRYVDPNSSLQFLYIRKVDGPSPLLSAPPLVTPIGYGDPMSDNKQKPYKQSWKSSQIAGQKVRWYQEDEGSGADFPAFSTEHFAITTASGQKEFYKILVCSGMQGEYLREIDQMMSSVQIR